MSVKTTSEPAHVDFQVKCFDLGVLVRDCDLDEAKGENSGLLRLITWVIRFQTLPENVKFNFSCNFLEALCYLCGEIFLPEPKSP